MLRLDHAGPARRRGAVLPLSLILGAVLAGAIAGCGADAPAAAPTPTQDTSSAPPQTASSVPTPTATSTPRPSSGPRSAPPIPTSAKGRHFSLVVKTDAGDLPARVAPLSVKSHQLVNPPQWNTAAWIVQAAYPTVNSTGTTYIYGHACRKIVCPFTRLEQTEPGDSVVVSTDEKTLTYTVTRTGLSSKKARSLPRWAADSTVKNRLVLVSCQIQDDELTPNNVLVVAELSSSRPAPS